MGIFKRTTDDEALDYREHPEVTEAFTKLTQMRDRLRELEQRSPADKHRAETARTHLEDREMMALVGRVTDQEVEGARAAAAEAERTWKTTEGERRALVEDVAKMETAIERLKRDVIHGVAKNLRQAYRRAGEALVEALTRAAAANAEVDRIHCLIGEQFAHSSEVRRAAGLDTHLALPSLSWPELRDRDGGKLERLRKAVEDIGNV